MDNNLNNKTTTYEVVDFSKKESKKGTSNFSNNIIIPFFSGILGTSLVIGTCFGVPEIRQKLIGINQTSITTSTSGSLDNSYPRKLNTNFIIKLF